MLGEMQSTATGGGIIIAGLLYAGVSAYGTGPLIGERMAAKMNWSKVCQAHVAARVKNAKPAPTFTPKLDCNAIMGWLGPQGQAYCRKHGHNFRFPFANQFEQHQRKLREQRRRILNQELSRSHSRCSCALTLTLERHRTSFAIHAAGARFLTPAPVKKPRIRTGNIARRSALLKISNFVEKETMIFGSISVTDKSVDTHRDSYLIEQLSVVSVRRPFMAGALLIGGSLTAFVVRFNDLLYMREVATLSTIGFLLLAVGWRLGQLQLLSRDLRGSELSGVVYGDAGRLNRIRRQIVRAIQIQKSGEAR